MWGTLLPPGNWGGGGVSYFLPPFLMATLRVEPRGLCILSKHSATELLHQPSKTFLMSVHLILVFIYVKETSCVLVQGRSGVWTHVWICVTFLCGPVLMSTHKVGPAHHQ